MHPSSHDRMAEFVRKYLNPNMAIKILDVGSYDVNGSYRDLFQNSNWSYMGADLKGSSINNVNIVLSSPYNWSNIYDESFDVVVSGQTLEHVEDMYKWMLEVKRVLKKGGLVCIIAPWQWEIHNFPLDCWRILPDGLKFLLEKIAEFQILEVFIRDFDCVGIAQK